MIAHLRGIVSRKTANSLVIDVSGVGYLVSTTTEVSQESSIGQELVLQTVQIFREDSVQLFGFASLEEIEVFNLLLGVTGVGAKTALAVISQLGVQGIQSAVANADSEAFNSLSGIGPKTAKLIILNLNGKLITDVAEPTSLIQRNVVSALVNLGFQERLAKQTTKNVVVENPTADEKDILKLALSALSSSRRQESNE